LQPDKRTGYTN